MHASRRSAHLACSCFRPVPSWLFFAFLLMVARTIMTPFRSGCVRRPDGAAIAVRMRTHPAGSTPAVAGLFLRLMTTVAWFRVALFDGARYVTDGLLVRCGLLCNPWHAFLLPVSVHLKAALRACEDVGHDFSMPSACVWAANSLQSTCCLSSLQGVLCRCGHERAAQ
jgi:hypothetical protein